MSKHTQSCHQHAFFCPTFNAKMFKLVFFFTFFGVILHFLELTKVFILKLMILMK